MVAAALGKTASLLDIAACLKHRNRLAMAAGGDVGEEVIKMNLDSEPVSTISVPLAQRTRRAA
jgi:hypothetical protein